MPSEKLTPAQIAELQEQLRRDSAELDAIIDNEAISAVLSSRSYIMAKDISEAASGLSSSQLDTWKREKMIFAFNYSGVEYFPLYALDPHHGWQPYAAMAEVLAVFDVEKGGWGCAFWFEGVNGYLGGRAPKDVLATDPGRVVEAATLEMSPVAHA